MAEIEFACEACEQTLEAPVEMAGSVVQCPACSADITIPAPEPTANTLAPTDIIFRALESEEASGQGNQCPECGADMEPESVLCIQCGFHAGLGQKISTDLA